MKNSEILLKFWEKERKKILSPILEDFPGISTGIDNVDEFFAQFGRVMSVTIEHSREKRLLYVLDMIFEEFPMNLTEQAKEVGIIVERATIQQRQNVEPMYALGSRFVPFIPIGTREIEGKISIRV